MAAAGVPPRAEPELRLVPGSLAMTLGTLLLVILIIALLATVPTWPYSRGWGYYPSGGIGIVLLIIIILLLLGRI